MTETRQCARFLVMGVRRLAAVLALSLSLLAPATAGAAEQLLDTITVEPASTSLAKGTYPLKKGQRYVIEVTGMMDSVNTDGGYGYRYDALYCVSGIGFDHEECEDERRDPKNRTLRNHNFGIGTAGVWRRIDQFTT